MAESHPRRPPRASFAALFVAIAASALLWQAATETITTSRRTIGNGTGRFEISEDHTNRALAGAAFVVLLAGTIAWILLHPGGKLKGKLLNLGPTAALLVLLPLVGGLLIIAEESNDVAFDEYEYYPQPDAILAALETAGIDCDHAASSHPRGKYWRSPGAVCEIDTRAALNDGADKITIEMWEVGGRERWTHEVANDDVYAVLGPTWLIRCEFQASCAQIQAAIGGRNY
jgi:hypothetical protein